MRAYELIKETFFRRSYIWIVHVVWLALYGSFWWLLLPEGNEFGRFILIWGGFLLPLALSAGIFGDDISSGRICVLMTKPFWSGQLYLYRLAGLSLQAAVHLLLAGGLVLVLHAGMHKGRIDNLGSWLFASWLLFNTCAALSTSLSVVVGRAYNSLLLLVTAATGYFILTLLLACLGSQASMGVALGFIRYAWPPFELLSRFAGGDFGRYSLTVGRLGLTESTACVVHSFMLTAAYSVAGIVLLGTREFSRVRD